MKHVAEILDIIGAQVDSIADANIVLGKPVELGKYKVIPLSRTNLGFGGGGGEGEGQGPHPPHHRHKQCANFKGKGIGGGVGGGGKVRPVGVIVLGGEGIKVLSIPDKQGLLDKLFEKVPALLDKFDGCRDKKKDS